jgi:murein DD-endopeptidase MepM/ murein hydrolase activator NlpD
MVPVRPLITALGGTVTWDGSAERVTVTYNGAQMAMWVGQNLAFKDGVPVWAPVAPYVANGRMMVPGYWVATRLGAHVVFDGTNLLVTTQTAPPPAASVGALLNPKYVFPYAQGAPYSAYEDTMGAPRYYNGKSSTHEGTDILAPLDTPILAVAAGTIVRYGWNTLGGYRVTIQLADNPDYQFYYAHMNRYAPGLGIGVKVQAGQVLGYTGHTGEGPERTEGNFVTHLHFGIYGPGFNALDPYPDLKFW